MKKIKFSTIFKISLILFFSFRLWGYELDEFDIKYDYTDRGISLLIKYPESKGEEPISVFYSSFNPFTGLYSSGKIKKGENLNLPFGTENCLWAKSSSGKLSKAFHLTAERSEQKKILNVLSPQEGVWNEVQKLVIKSPPKTQIMYSVDGSNPSEFGLLYTDPIVIEKEGKIELRIKAVSETEYTTEKKIQYEVSPLGLNTPKTDKIDFNKAESKQEPYNILNWYFVEFDIDSPLYYCIKEKNEETSFSDLLNIYEGPIFTDRTKDKILYWAKKEDGKINKLLLPKKPVLNPPPIIPVNRNIELKFDDTRYTYFFEVGDGNTFLDPTQNSSKFEKDASLTFDLGIMQERFFDIKIRAFFDGIFHGEFKTAFTIDKLPPEKPEVSFVPPVSPTNSNVKIKIMPVPDAEIIAEIEPPIFTSSGKEFILTGSIGEKTVYSVNIYSKDEAGNRSSPVTKEIVIDRNAVYVDYNSKAISTDGNPSKPFSTIYEAVDYINKVSFSKKNNVGSEKWKIYLRGDCILNEAVLITKNIKMSSIGQRSSIHFSKNAGFVVIGASFEIENFDIFRRERSEEPREVPIVYADKASIKLNNVKIQASEGGTVLNSFYSHFDISESKIISEQTNYCLIFNLNNSSAVLHNSDFTGSGFSVAAISSSNSTIEFDDIRASFNTGFTARFLEAWNSEISLGRLNIVRFPETGQNRDTAVWYNKNSKIDIKNKPIVRGFSKSIEREP